MLEEIKRPDPNDPGESKKDVSEKWLDDIYFSLRTLEMFERQLRAGVVDLFEFLHSLGYSNATGKAAIAQAKAIQLVTDEFELILNNTEKIIPKDKLKDLRTKLLFCLNIQGGKYGKMFDYKYRSQNMSSGSYVCGINLYKPFFIFQNTISQMRKELVSCLSHILFVTDKKKNLKSKAM